MSTLPDWLRMHANRCEHDEHDDCDEEARKCREAADRIEQLESELAALRSKLSPPWLDAPDGPGYWWRNSHGSISIIEIMKLDDGKLVAFSMGQCFDAKFLTGGRWSRPITPEGE